MDLIGKIKRAPEQWHGSIFTTFNDGDIIDSLDINNLENHHECTQDEPECSAAWGGRFQCQTKTDFVSLGLNRDTRGISFEITNNIDDVKTKEELETLFHWYFSLNTRTNEISVHYCEDSDNVKHIEAMTWEKVSEWLMQKQPLIFVKEYRERVIPIYFDEISENRHAQ